MELIIVAIVIGAIISAFTKLHGAKMDRGGYGTEQKNRLEKGRANAERAAAREYAAQDRSPQGYAAQQLLQQAYVADREKSNRSQQLANEYAAIWGIPSYEAHGESAEGGTKDGGPFCQGPAGSFASTEGMDELEGQNAVEGRGEAGGEGYAGFRGGEGETAFPRLRIPRTKVDTHEAAEPLQTEQPRIELSFDRDAAVRGVLYAEVFGKPKALRR